MLARNPSSSGKDAAPAAAAPPVGAHARVCLGVITGTRGLKGELRIKSFTEKPMDLAAYGMLTDESGGRTFVLKPLSMVRGQVIARLDGVQTVDAAAALKGTRLYVDRDALPQAAADEFYHADLIGLQAEDTHGRALGTVAAVHDYGAGTVLEIGAAGLMIPFTQKAVPVVDLEGSRMVVDPPLEIEEEIKKETVGDEA